MTTPQERLRIDGYLEGQNMMERVRTLKGIVAAAAAALAALWGWLGWLVAVWVVLMGLNRLSRFAAAVGEDRWSLRLVRDGSGNRLLGLAAVVAAGMLDLMAGAILEGLSLQSIPIACTGVLCPLVVVWLLLTELEHMVETIRQIGHLYRNASPGMRGTFYR